jgi:hypothetical protein
VAKPTPFTYISPAVMDTLGREDTALLLLARSETFDYDASRDAMQQVLAEIERDHHFGTINRAFGPLNAEACPPSAKDIEVKGAHHVSVRLDANFPLLDLRNDAMLDEARRLAGYDELQLRQVIQTAKHIKKTRGGGSGDWSAKGGLKTIY